MAPVGSVDDLLSLASDQVLEVITPLDLIRNPEAAMKLGLPTDDVGYVAYRLLYEGKPYGLTRIFIPPFAAAVLSDVGFLHQAGAHETETVIQVLNRKLQNPLAMARMVVIAVAASVEVATIIDCTPAQPLLNIEILYFDTDSRPIQLNLNLLNSELYEYRAQLQRRPDSASTLWSTAISSQIAENGTNHR